MKIGYPASNPPVLIERVLFVFKLSSNVRMRKRICFS